LYVVEVHVDCISAVVVIDVQGDVLVFGNGMEAVVWGNGSRGEEPLLVGGGRAGNNKERFVELSGRERPRGRKKRVREGVVLGQIDVYEG